MSAVMYAVWVVGCPAVTIALMMLMMRAPVPPAEMTRVPDPNELADVRRELRRQRCLSER